MIHILNGNCYLPYKSFTFSGGEIQVKLVPANMEYNVKNTFELHAKIHSAADLFELALVVDAIKRWIGAEAKFNLYLPYMPYARQDRVCDKGEALAIKVAADFINSLNFEKVVISDPHSDVTTALLNNVEVQSLVDIFKDRFVATIAGLQLISPDAGANKKVQKLAQEFHLNMIRADKIRDVKDGKITGTIVYDEGKLNTQDCLVVDDICDGGRTFIELAKELKKKTSGKLYLYVTHGIFSKGLDELLQYYDKIYCPYVFPNVTPNERLIQI
jgi:ribose-phosphate pyrophosphokinase